MTDCPLYPSKRRFETKQEAKEASRLAGFGVKYYYCGRKGCGGYHIGHKHKNRGKDDKKPRLKRKRTTKR